MPDSKRSRMSLGLEPSLRASSLYRCGIMTVGRNARAFLENAADKRRMRTAWGSVHGKIKLWIEMRLGKLPLEVCFLLRGRVPVKQGDEVENSDQIAAETGKPGRL